MTRYNFETRVCFADSALGRGLHVKKFLPLCHCRYACASLSCQQPAHRPFVTVALVGASFLTSDADHRSLVAASMITMLRCRHAAQSIAGSGRRPVRSQRQTLFAVLWGLGGCGKCVFSRWLRQVRTVRQRVKLKLGGLKPCCCFFAATAAYTHSVLQALQLQLTSALDGPPLLQCPSVSSLFIIFPPAKACLTTPCPGFALAFNNQRDCSPRCAGVYPRGAGCDAHAFLTKRLRSAQIQSALPSEFMHVLQMGCRCGLPSPRDFAITLLAPRLI